MYKRLKGPLFCLFIRDSEGAHVIQLLTKMGLSNNKVDRPIFVSVTARDIRDVRDEREVAISIVVRVTPSVPFVPSVS